MATVAAQRSAVCGLEKLVLPQAIDTPLPATQKIDEYIKQLDDPKFAVRQGAEKALAAAGGKALTKLEAALQSSSPDVRRAAERLLTGYIDNTRLKLDSELPARRSTWDANVITERGRFRALGQVENVLLKLEEEAEQKIEPASEFTKMLTTLRLSANGRATEEQERKVRDLASSHSLADCMKFARNLETIMPRGGMLTAALEEAGIPVRQAKPFDEFLGNKKANLGEAAFWARFSPLSAAIFQAQAWRDTGTESGRKRSIEILTEVAGKYADRLGEPSGSYHWKILYVREATKANAQNNPDFCRAYLSARADLLLHCDIFQPIHKELRDFDRKVIRQAAELGVLK